MSGEKRNGSRKFNSSYLPFVRNLAVKFRIHLPLTSHTVHCQVLLSLPLNISCMAHPLLHQCRLILLLRGSDPPASLTPCVLYHGCFLYGLPLMFTALMLEGWFSTQKALQPQNHSGPSLLWAGVSVQPVKQHTKTFQPGPDYLQLVFSCHILMSLSPKYYLLLQLNVLYVNPCWAWDSCPSAGSSRWPSEG